MTTALSEVLTLISVAYVGTAKRSASIATSVFMGFLLTLHSVLIVISTEMLQFCDTVYNIYAKK